MTTPGDADDERTVTQGARALRHADARAHGAMADALPPGTRLHEFEIESVIGQGGFGIVYLAHDLSLDRQVAIKEYMPSSLATRTHAMTVEVRSSRHTETFAAGLRSFVNEARLLARFDHPSLLKVHRFWQDHGTAYMVMPYYAGITLTQQLADAGAPPSEMQLRRWVGPLLDALELLHTAHCFHRDVAPDNILLLPGGAPLLLDFGAARQVIGDMTQALTVILKTGYAPIEQYGGLPDMPQGPWTDLYALGSVVEFAITGDTPAQAVTRYLADKRIPLAQRAAGRYDEPFLNAIDRALAVLPKDRPQSVAQMRALLDQRRAPAEAGMATARTTDPDVRSAAPIPTPTPTPSPTRTQDLGATVAYVDRRLGTSGLMRRRWVVGGMGLAGVLAVSAGGVAWWAGRKAPTAAEVPTNASSAGEVDAPTGAGVDAKRQATGAQLTHPPTTTTTTLPMSPPAEPATDSNDARLAPADAPRSPPEPPPPAAGIDAAPPPHSVRPIEARPPRRTIEHDASQNKHRLPAEPTAQPPPVVVSKLPSPRCADIIQRVSLGENLTEAERTILKKECGK